MFEQGQSAARHRPLSKSWKPLARAAQRVETWIDIEPGHPDIAVLQSLFETLAGRAGIAESGKDESEPIVRNVFAAGSLFKLVQDREREIFLSGHGISVGQRGEGAGMVVRTDASVLKFDDGFFAVSQQQIRKAERMLSRCEARFEGQRFPGLLERRFIISSHAKIPGGLAIDDQRQRIELQGVADLIGGFFETAQRREQGGVFIMRCRVVGIRVQRLAEFRFGGHEVKFERGLHPCERRARFSEFAIQANRGFRILLRGLVCG